MKWRAFKLKIKLLGKEVKTRLHRVIMRETRWNFKVNFDEEEKRKMYHDLCNPMDTYKEMAKRIGTFSSIDHLLNNTYLIYNT